MREKGGFERKEKELGGEKWAKWGKRKKVERSKSKSKGKSVRQERTI